MSAPGSPPHGRWFLPRLHDAHHPEGFAGKHHGGTNHGSIAAEAGLPEVMVQNRHVPLAFPLVLLLEDPADGGPIIHDPEELGRGDEAFDAFGTLRSLEDVSPPAEYADVGERVGSLRPVRDVRG